MLGAARHLRQLYQRVFCVLIFLVLTTGSVKQDVIDKVVATVDSQIIMLSDVRAVTELGVLVMGSELSFRAISDPMEFMCTIFVWITGIQKGPQVKLI